MVSVQGGRLSLSGVWTRALRGAAALPERRARLADDVRRLAGRSGFVFDEARRLGAEVPDGLAPCSLVWLHWSDWIAEWAKANRP